MDLISFGLRLLQKFPALLIGLGILGLSPCVWMILDASKAEVLQWESSGALAIEKEAASFSFGMEKVPFFPSFEKALEQIEWSSDPIRPDRIMEQNMLTLSLKDSKETKKVNPICEVPLYFDENNALRLAGNLENFWMEVSDSWFCLKAKDLEGQIVASEIYPIIFKETSFRSLGELAENNPFSMLRDAKCLGQDLFLSSIEPGAEVQRIEFSSKEKGEILDLRKTDWLVFDGEKWEIGSLSTSKPPLAIARWTQKIGQTLEMEGWKQDLYLRFKLEIAQLPSLKKDGLFSQLKIRSEKQVSCTIDQQYLILKPGDWLLKSDQRWKVLRKKDEKEALLNGKLSGDLFLLDKIELKNGSKRIVGKLFGPTRTQMTIIDGKPTDSQLKSRRKTGKAKPPQERNRL